MAATMDVPHSTYQCNVEPKDALLVQNDFEGNPVSHNMDLEFEIVGKNGVSYSVWLSRDAVKELHSQLTDALHNSFENGAGAQIQKSFNELAKERLNTPMNGETDGGAREA